MEVRDVESLEWFRPLVEQVQSEVARRVDNQPDKRAALEQEWKEITAKRAGWSVSLSKPDLNPALRAEIEADWEKALMHQQEIESLLMEMEHFQQHVQEILDPGQVVDRLDRLPEVLALNNPTLGNLELSLHIDRIDCFKDGKVAMRICKLGALAGAAEFLAEDVAGRTEAKQVASDGTKRAVPRRRARLRVEQAEGYRDLKAAADTAADPNRFAGLSEEWFWEDIFQIPEKTWPFQEMAIEAATQRPGQTHEKLAENFGVTVPTIRKALRYAAEVDERFRELPSKMPRDRWHEDHAHEVAAKKAEGLGTDELAAFFGKSDTTIRKALEHARKASAPAPEAGEAGAA